MAVELDFDPLTSEPREKERPVPVRNNDPSKGTIRVTLRDIPRGRYNALMSAHQTAVGAFANVFNTSAEQAEKLIEGASSLDEVLAVATIEILNVKKMGHAWQLLHMARAELVRWGVCGHQADDFMFPKAAGESPSPTPFEDVKETWEGELYALANNRMISLYSHPRVGILGNLAAAVRAFNEDKWKTPEQIWGEEKKDDATQKKKPLGKKKAL